ncbi:DNA-directed RNA polymerase III subunit RPC5 [Schistosoma bovis]|uniref:DNA-directed RNA polymerase III subunit RPC5 n=1 Tax=Schistosoma bovis TaxID=6184 RepID=A0A430QB99_SCHBO|nr:DNA-directed RNA polymerase III subunit RPC5 [Schistosoma bovis]
MDVPAESGSDEPGVLKEYKNRENYHTLDNESIKEARIKPNLDLLEFVVEDGRSSFVESVGEQMYVSVFLQYYHPLRDTYLLRSNTVAFPRTLLGYFVNDECHFIPLKRDALVLDTCKEAAKVDKTNQNSDSSTSTPVGPAAFVSARLRTADAIALRGPMASRRKPADSDPDVIFLKQQVQAPWCPVHYKRFIPSEAFERRIPLLYPNDDMPELTRNRVTGPSQEEYVNNLLASVTPHVVDEAFERRIPLLYPNDDMPELTRNRVTGPSQEEYVNNLLASVTPHVVDRSRTEPVKLPTLGELIQTIMIKAQLIRFDKLVICLRERFKDPHSVTNTSVLQYLPTFAVLLRGWWVAKSEILYPPNSFSEHSGTPNTLLIRARDYIMAVFHRGEHLTRKTISCMTKVPTVEATEILKSLACKMSTTQKGCANHWEFYPTDYDFIKNLQDHALVSQLHFSLETFRDGVRRKRNPGQHSGESGSDSDSGFKSLVSGVHISTPSKNTNRKRLRQSSVCHTTDTDKDANNSLKPPGRKRVRTQSLSSSYSSGLSSPHSTSTKLPCLQTDGVSSKFCIPTSPPPVKINSPKLKTVGCKLEPPTPEDRDPDIPTAAAAASVTDSEMNELKLKRSPSSHDISQSAIMDNGHNDTNSNTELSSQTDLISNHIGLPCTPLQPVNDTNIDNNDSVLKFDSDNEMPELLMNNSINFVKNVLNTQPIVALSALTKVYQNSPPPPPGSESERELLKTYLLKVLQTIDARQLTVCWPNIPTALEKEPLFVIKVAGPECGAVSESIAQFRDIILALYESLPSFKMKDLQEKCPIFPPKGMSEKAMRTFIKTHFYSLLDYMLRTQDSIKIVRLIKTDTTTTTNNNNNNNNNDNNNNGSNNTIIQ